MKRLLLLLLFPAVLFAQGYSLQTFSQFPSGHTLVSCNGGSGDCLTLFNSWFGTGTNNGSGNQVITNSSGALTIQSATACADGDPPGHSGNYLNYSTSLGGGNASQNIFLRAPTSGASSAWGGSFWFCTTIPATPYSFGTTFDFFQLITGVQSRLGNYDANGTNASVAIEGGSGGQHVNFTPNTHIKIVWQYVPSAACGDITKFSDCIVIQAYTTSGTLLGTAYSTGAAGAPLYLNFGNGNSIALCTTNCGPGVGQNAGMPPGAFTEYSDIQIYNVGYSTSQFAALGAAPLPSDGIVTPGRATDWTKAGFNIPSASWTQCGPTIAAYTGTATTITTALAACGANQYVQLGSGTFVLSTGILYPSSHNKLVLRGNGANSTFLTFTGSPGVACGSAGPSLVCQKGGTPNGSAGGQTTTWTSGFPQGSTVIGVGSSTGITTSSALLLNVADTGYSGDPATGCAIDNGQWFNTGDQFATTGCNNPNGVSQDGPNGFNTGRQQAQLVYVTNVSGTNLTISPPIVPTNIPVSNTPDVYAFTPAVQLGLENLSIDGTGVTTGVGVAAMGCYQCWTSGVAIKNMQQYGFNGFYLLHYEFVSNYVYHIAGNANPYGVRRFVVSSSRFHNNIIQQALTPLSFDGAANGNVEAYNTCLQATPTSNLFQECFNEHGPADHNLFEGNYGNAIAAADGIHNSSFAPTLFRNFITATVSAPPTLASSPTQMSVLHSYGSRGANDIANVFGTPAFATNTYQFTSTCSPANNHTYAYQIGVSCQGNVGSMPNDTLSGTSLVRYGNWDVVTAAIRWCGNARNTLFTNAGNCNSVSEAAASFSTYPGFVPVVGDTTAGQPPLPASFYLTSKPSWFGSLPWPSIGPDITGGNIVYCTGTWNTTSQMAGVPVTSGTQCPVSGTTTVGWAGHVNAIPSLNCYLSLGGKADGSGAAIPFDAGGCYAGAVPAPLVSFSPINLNVGQAPVGLTSNPSSTVTLTNVGTANLVVGSISMLVNSIFSLTNNTCGASATVTLASPGAGFTLTPGQFCTFQVIFQPVGAPQNWGGQVSFADNTSAGSDIFSVFGTSTGPPATSPVNFAGIMSDRTLCPVVPATTQLCYSLQCACMWISMNGGSYIPMGVSSVNGLSGKVVLPIPTKAVSTTTTVIQ